MPLEQQHQHGCAVLIGLTVGTAVGGFGLGIADFVLSPKYENMYSQVIGKYKYKSEQTVTTGVIDPSGFAYEAVLSNRLEGVEATVWQKETKQDIYGESYEEISQWNAALYGQINPQITKEDGVFAWDVPDGL